MEIRFLGHACFELTEGDTRVLIDPFLTGNPKAAAEARRRRPDPHLPHARPRRPQRRHRGHRQAHGRPGGGDRRAGRTSSGEQGVENVADPNIGGTVEFDGGWVRLVPAWHTSTSPNGTVHTPAGLVINLGGKTVYHLGDTWLFSDLALPAQARHDRRGARCASAATTRWTATTPWRRPSSWRRHGDPVPLRHVPADRDRRRGVQGGVESRTGGQTAVEVLHPARTFSLSV